MNVYFTAEDVRQYAYCKRKIYFRYVLRARFLPTVKMERGEEEHIKFEKKWRKRKENNYFSLHLFSEKLGLIGVVDYFSYENGEIIPIEVKFGGCKRLYSGHYLQLVAHALLLEDIFGVEVKKGIIEYPDEKISRVVKITNGAKLKVMDILSKIKRIVLEEEIPPPPPDIAKCYSCEAYRICRRC